MTESKRQRQKAQTKEHLIETAYAVFSSRGIMAARMADIAAAAGVSHGTVFLHFNTQEALIEEVVAHYGALIALETHALAERCGSMEELLRAHLGAISAYEPFYTRLVLENRMLPTAARDSWIDIQSAVSLHFNRVAERESSRIEKRGIPDAMLFNMWMGLVHYYLANGGLFAPEGNVIRRHGTTLVGSFLKLLNG
ncbi:transcriptional regulator, TetR family [Sporobacter termitidis DSM 10068]|uniref:Transcriptional regulator, TetR family n=1 Tax=Sporobacter termitidis DSM 10068 TaxID=1123282 RepID=A0A1M5TY78_9FIRM|nr:TetR/AcrR family transcriptional regulator [Sporobacter termitidis]SHH55611.1 transcriptional regulator, TetR family [Sporobacter termitidis DSM 10068]